LARWRLREWLFKLNEPKPEVFSPGKQTSLIVFAWATWLYRLVLFIGIALMVYHLFTKLLGVVLFVIEIYWFIWFPVRSELREWVKRKAAILQSQRSKVSGGVAGLLLLLFAIPLPTHVSVSALFKPSEMWPVHAPGPAVVGVLHARHGQEVKAGQALVNLRAPDVLLQMNISQSRWQRLTWQASTSGMPEGQQGTPLALSQTQLRSAQAEFDRAQQMQQRYQPNAPFAGRFLLHDPDMQAGQWLDKNEKVGTVIGHAPWRIETWVDEEQARRIAIGASAQFIAPGLPHTLKAQVVSIDKDTTRVLPDGQLTAPQGGHILVREQQGKWLPDQGVYRVSLSLNEPYTHDLMAVQRGMLSVDAQAHSLAGQYLRHALAVVIRELKP
jgi:putative peptide zinc metalloprotease protein